MGMPADEEPGLEFGNYLLYARRVAAGMAANMRHEDFDILTLPA